MTFDYAKPAATAIKLIARYGRTIQHQRITEGPYSPETGSVTNTTVSTNVKAVDFDFKLQSAGQVFTSDSLVQVGDRYALIGAEVVAIDTSDKLLIDGVTWNIINVKKLAPAGTLVLWNVHIRK